MIVNGQHFAFYGIPAIYRIDDAEKYLTEHYGPEWTAKHGTNWLSDFYIALENGPNDPKYNEIMDTGDGFRSILEDQNLTFIINGWLYVLSYDPILVDGQGSHDEGVYKNYQSNYTYTTYIRRVWLYKKNVRTGGDWTKANYNTIRQDALTSGGYNVDGFSFSPQRSTIGGKSALYKLPAFKDAVVVLCGVELWYNSYPSQTLTQLIILLPANYLQDGSIMFDFRKYFNINIYPDEFLGMVDGGKIINTIDNLGNKRDINLHFKTDSTGRPTSVFWDGGYGSGGFTAH